MSPAGRPASTGVPGPDRRTGRYAISPGTLASLLAGRAAYRLVLLAAVTLLLPVWGEDRYGTYAAAMATFSWLTALAVTGPEKALLKLRPRAPRVGAAVSDALVAVVWWLPLPLVAVFALRVVVRGPEDRAAVYLGAAAMLLSVGCTMLLVGLQRAAGRPRPDALAFLTMSVVQLALLGAATAGLGPTGYLAGVVVVQLGVNLVLSATLGRPSLRIRHRPRLLRRLAATAVLLAGPDLFLYLSTAVLFTVLVASPHAGQVARLYVISVVWSAAVNMLIYVLRVYAPGTALRLTGRAGWTGRTRAARIARGLAWGNAVWLAGMVALLAGTGLAGVTAATAQTLVWAGALATRTPLLAALLWATFQLENTDATAPRVVALAAAAGLAVTVLAGLVAVPALGGLGVIVSLGVAELAYATVLAARADPRRPDRPVRAGRRRLPAFRQAG